MSEENQEQEDLLDRILSVHLEARMRQNLEITYVIIYRQACQIYYKLSGKKCNPFDSSMDWIRKICRKWLIYIDDQADKLPQSSCESVNVDNESCPEINSTESSHNDVRNEFLHQFLITLDHNNYSNNQVFYVFEFDLFWKRLPYKSISDIEMYIEPNNRASEDKLSLLICGNVTGDFKLKPMAVHNSFIPECLEKFSIGFLPVIWKSNSKAEITQNVFDEFFNYHICPSIFSYLVEKKLPEKGLLILKKSHNHPEYLNDIRENLDILYTLDESFIQIENNFKHIFRLNYYKRFVFNIMDMINKKDFNFSVIEYWFNYTMKSCIDNIGIAWNDVPSSLLYDMCLKLWPKSENTSVDYTKAIIEESMNEILKISKNCTTEEVNLTALENLYYYESAKQDQKKTEVTLLKQDDISEALNLIKDGLKIMIEKDLNLTRSSATNNCIETALQCYRKLLN